MTGRCGSAGLTRPLIAFVRNIWVFPGWSDSVAVRSAPVRSLSSSPLCPHPWPSSYASHQLSLSLHLLAAVAPTAPGYAPRAVVLKKQAEIVIDNTVQSHNRYIEAQNSNKAFVPEISVAGLRIPPPSSLSPIFPCMRGRLTVRTQDDAGGATGRPGASAERPHCDAPHRWPVASVSLPLPSPSPPRLQLEAPRCLPPMHAFASSPLLALPKAP